jgi:hypothetical protein
MAVPVDLAHWRCGVKRNDAATPPLPLGIDEMIERAFRTAAFDERKVSLWVRKRPDYQGHAMSASTPEATKLLRHNN